MSKQKQLHARSESLDKMDKRHKTPAGISAAVVSEPFGHSVQGSEGPNAMADGSLDRLAATVLDIAAQVAADEQHLKQRILDAVNAGDMKLAKSLVSAWLDKPAGDVLAHKCRESA